jgi:curved DNA-binding protein CbpA
MQPSGQPIVSTDAEPSPESPQGAEQPQEPQPAPEPERNDGGVSTEGGSLASRDIAELFASMYLKRRTGLLVLRQEAVDKALQFEKGSPVSIESCLPAESFGAYLERMGRLNKNQLKEIERERCGEGHREVELLLARGWLNPNEIFASITEHVTETAISCFSWHEGDYSFTDGAGPGAGNIPLRLDMSRLILDGIKRHYNLARLNKRLSITNETLLHIKEGSDVRSNDLKLTTAEARMFETLRHGVTFGELLMQATDKSVEVLALVYGLEVLGLLLRDDNKRESIPVASPSPGRFVHVSSPPPRRTPSPSRRRTTSTPRGEGIAESTPPPDTDGAPKELSPEDEMLQELNELKDADYFTLLGLSRDAELNEVHRAFRKRVKRFHQDRLSTFTPEVQGKGKKVYLRLMEGYRVLTDPEQRDQYLTELEENEPLVSEEPPPPAPPTPPPRSSEAESSETGAKDSSTPLKSTSSKPPSSRGERPSRVSETPSEDDIDYGERLERLIERIQEFLLAEKFTAAVTTLQNALSEPYEKVRIHAWLGWVLYNKSPEKFMGEAESQLAEARRADPNHPEPYLFMARIREAEDSADQAHTYYKKAADVAPRDRLIVKELKNFEKRMEKGALKVRPTQAAPKRGSKAPAKARAKTKSRAPAPKKESSSVLDQDVGAIFKSLFKGKKG